LDGRISAQATAINDDGQIVGWSESWQTSQPAHAFLWENGVMIDLGTLGGAYSRPTDINNAGQIVGQSTGMQVGHYAIGPQERMPATLSCCALAYNLTGVIDIRGSAVSTAECSQVDHDTVSQRKRVCRLAGLPTFAPPDDLPVVVDRGGLSADSAVQGP